MADEPSSEANQSASEPPSPEALKPQSDGSAVEPAAASENGQPAADGKSTANPDATAPPRLRRAYRPSHKATFVGLSAIVVILAINAAVITFVIKGQSSPESKAAQGQVTIGQDVLDKLGVNRGSVGNAGVELTINPDTSIKGKLEVGGDVSLAGQLKLNSKFTASDASLAKLDAGNTSLNQLNVNGDATASSLNLRSQLAVTGTTRLQGDVTMSRLLTVNNSANVAGNLSVGGALSVNRFQSSSLVVDGNITIGGKFISRGAAPRVGPGGGALGSNGTVSISGSDAVGTVAVNVGTGATAGIVANVAFRSAYDTTPRVVVTAVGAGIGSVYVNRSAAGFSIGVNSPTPPGGYAFDYIVMQ